MKIKILGLLVLIGLTLILGASPVFAGDAGGSISTGVETGLGGIVKAAPTATPPAGTYATAQTVSLSASGSSVIYYTTDSTSIPSTSWTKYSSPFSSTSTSDFRASAYYTDGTFGPVGHYSYLLVAPVTAGGGGGGGPAFIPVSTPSPGITDFGSIVNANGLFTTSVTASSADKSAFVTINSGITGRTISGASITRISIVSVVSLGDYQLPLANFQLNNTFYNFGPDGATFSGPVSITLPLSVGLVGQCIVYYDASNNTPGWKQLDTVCVYDNVNNTITGQTTHFTIYGVMVPVNQAPVLPAPVSPTTPAITSTIKPAPTPSISPTLPITQTPPPMTLLPPVPTAAPPISSLAASATAPLAATPTAPWNLGLIIGVVVGCLVALTIITIVLRRRNNTF